MEACFAAASEMKAPVIIACTPYVQMEELAMAVRMYEKKYPEVTAALHLDHGKEYEDVQRALRCGFTSVMLDKIHTSLWRECKSSERGCAGGSRSRCYGGGRAGTRGERSRV